MTSHDPTWWGALCYRCTALALEQTREMRRVHLGVLKMLLFGVAPSNPEILALISSLRELLAQTPALDPAQSVRTWAHDAGIPWAWSPSWRSTTPDGELVVIFALERTRIGRR